MSSFKLTHVLPCAVAFGLLVPLAACTVQPLNATRNTVDIAQDGTSSTVQSAMQSMTVAPVSDRVAQQVRNSLLFELNGGQTRPAGQFEVTLKVVTSSRSLAIESDSLSTTAAQVAITVDYQIIDKTSDKTVSGGKRRSVASFDKTPQSFASERAERDAENRAAKEVARQLRLAIAQTLSRL